MTEKQFRWCAVALIVFAAILAYANTFTSDFVWDDASSILLHEDVKNPANVIQLFLKDQHPFGRGQGNFYRPLVSLTFMIEYWLSKPAEAVEGAPAPLQLLSPFLFHVGNTLWHALVAVLMFAFMTQLDAPRFVRLLAPLVYVVHPLHTEAVAYISGRADSMAAAFALAALCAAFSTRSKMPVLWCGLFFACALLSKESAIIFPFVLLLAYVLLKKEAVTTEEAPPRRSLLASLIVSGVLVGVYGALRFTVLNFSEESSSTTTALSQRLLEAGQAFALYLKLIFIPLNLHMERTLNGVPAWLSIAGWISLLLLVLVIGAAYFANKKRIAFGLCFFLLTWFPISGIFPLNAPMAEHWLYLPLIGFTWAFFEILWLLVGKTPLRYPTYAAAYVVVLLLVLATTTRNHDWRDNQTLYLATLRENPDSLRVHFNLAVTYEDLLNNSSGARRQYERVLELHQARKAQADNPAVSGVFYDDEMESHLSLARIYAKENLPDRAQAHFEVLRRLNLTDKNAAILSRTYLEYAQLLVQMGRGEDANKILQEGGERIPALKEQIESVQKSAAAANAASASAPPAGTQPEPQPNATE
ncbi:MAG TPA: hypothetical protein PLJ47_11615 [Candidatus Hydrogenedentes bacterium]|nr:hypothetical protein [Candidatus Hydrogenedentota bacterium]